MPLPVNKTKEKIKKFYRDYLLNLGNVAERLSVSVEIMISLLNILMKYMMSILTKRMMKIYLGMSKYLEKEDVLKIGKLGVKKVESYIIFVK